METRNDMPVFGMAVPPGSIIKDVLADRGMKQRELAQALDMQPSHLNEMLKGARRITPEIAVRLEQVLGGKATMWINLQTQYECNVAALKEREAAARKAEAIELKNIIDIYDSVIEWCRESKRRLEERLQMPVPAGA